MPRYNAQWPASVHWIEPFPEGIYVKPADAWVDPSQPKAQALVTHGHADHARGGHGAVWATPETLAIMDVRYGAAERPVRSAMARASGSARSTSASSPPAMCWDRRRSCSNIGGERVVVSGDYKRRPDPTCAPFVVMPCDIFITEATFGLPVFRHPDTGSEIDRLLHRLHAEPERCVLVGAYALGKAQRVIMELRGRGHDDADLHPRRDGAAVRALRGAGRAARRAAAGDRGVARTSWQGQIVLCPPGALNDRWSRRLPDPITAMASGWMRIRQRARQRNVELPLVISDHADWDELTQTIREVAPKEVWITHGREDALMHWCMTHQIKARELNLVGYEDEDD